MSKMSYRHPDTIRYKLRHSEYSRLAKAAVLIGRTEGIRVLLSAIIQKINVTINSKWKINQSKLLLVKLEAFSDGKGRFFSLWVRDS